LSGKQEKKFRKINRKVLARTAVKSLIKDLDTRDQKIKVMKRFNMAALGLIAVLILATVFLAGKAY